MDNKKLYRSRTNIVLSGVCGGLSDYLKIDAVIVRLGFVLLALLTAIIPCLILYICAMFLIPEEDHRSPADLSEPEEQSKD
ncbi:PspC domain-containing protein [Pradoshia sp.]|uniref:PspC domain-containing protein n=1 Tax=Pradoshia sp. TaxID=2651281 RepID=UPI003F0E0D52